jgi:hypothetical protein
MTSVHTVIRHKKNFPIQFFLCVFLICHFIAIFCWKKVSLKKDLRVKHDILSSIAKKKCSFQVKVFLPNKLDRFLR